MFTSWKFGLLVAGGAMAQVVPVRFLMGGFQSEIAVFEYDPYANTLDMLSTSDGDTSENKGWMGRHPINPHILVTCNDVAVANMTGYMQTFSLDPASGSITLIDQVDSGGHQTPNGVTAAHCAFFPNGKTAGVANYFGQAASFYAFNATSGKFGEQLPTLDYYGYVPRDGQNTAGDLGSSTQLTAHPHMIVTHPWINTLYIPDLGQDTLHVYNFDESGALTNFTHYDQPLGTGPRHLAITPSGRYLYLLHEIAAEIRAYEVNLSDGTLTQIQDDISIIPDNVTHTLALSGSEVHVSNDGRFLYASNRNLTDASLIESTDPSDTIAVFSIHPATGCLEKIQSAMMPGARQIRSIELSSPGYTGGAGGQDFLVAGSLKSNSTAVFKRDRATGLLELSAVYHHPELINPSTYVWL